MIGFFHFRNKISEIFDKSGVEPGINWAVVARCTNWFFYRLRIFTLAEANVISQALISFPIRSQLVQVSRGRSVLGSDLGPVVQKSHNLLTIPSPLEKCFFFSFKISSEWNYVALLACICRRNKWVSVHLLSIVLKIPIDGEHTGLPHAI